MSPVLLSLLATVQVILEITYSKVYVLLVMRRSTGHNHMTFLNKPLLDNMVSEASRILNLSEAVSSGHYRQDRLENHIQPLQSSLNTCLGGMNLEKNIVSVSIPDVCFLFGPC